MTTPLMEEEAGGGSDVDAADEAAGDEFMMAPTPRQVWLSWLRADEPKEDTAEGEGDDADGTDGAPGPNDWVSWVRP